MKKLASTETPHTPAQIKKNFYDLQEIIGIYGKPASPPASLHTLY